MIGQMAEQSKYASFSLYDRDANCKSRAQG